MIARLAVLLALVAIPAGGAAQARPIGSANRLEPPASAARAALVARLDSLVVAAVADLPVASASIAVVRGSDTLVRRAVGFADLESGEPASPDSPYRIGSITKSFTAAAIMQQVEQGRIGLDDELGKYLPDYPAPGRHATIRELLDHTSGIPDYTSLGDAFESIGGNDVAQDSLIALFAHLPLVFPSGTQWSYTNSGYALLGLVLERVTGEAYADYLRRHVFARAGLQHTAYCDDRVIVPHRARGYALASGEFVNAAPIGMTVPFSAGALCATTGDLVRWVRALRDGRVVSAASYHAMTTPTGAARRISADDSTLGYGFGLLVGSLNGHAYVAHDGGINGFSSFLTDFPDDSLTVAVLVNTEGGRGATLVAQQLVEAAFGLPVAPTPPPRAALTAPPGVTLAPAERARYVGRYQLRREGGNTRSAPFVLTVRIYEENGRLMVQSPGGAPDPLVALGRGVFVPRDEPSLRYEFDLPDSAPLATRVVVRAPGATLVGDRVGG